MPQFIYDIIVWINIAAFVVAFVDKIACGLLTPVLWLVALPGGALGAAAGCFVFNHHTASGEGCALGGLAGIQFLILIFIESIFG